MIRAGIIGGSNPMAGELIRLLINHPDVEILWVDSARFTGRLVSDVHHGLLGETELRISPLDNNNLKDIDALFIFRHKGQTLEWLSEHEIPEKLRIVDLSVDMRDTATAQAHEFVYGLPELNRKAMVRGAKRAIVPHPVANISALMILPLAKIEALSGPIDIKVSMAGKIEPIEDLDAVIAEIHDALASLQSDFASPITLSTCSWGEDRAMQATITLDTTLDIGEILRAYEEFFDDHNFTFVVNHPLQAKEVEGTNKCLMTIDKADTQLRICAIMDGIVKGAAGTAVHDMNLLFGLHERVGLALKASIY